MPEHIDERLEKIKAELARQDGAWRHAQRVLARFGDATVFVPDEFLESIEAPANVATERQFGIRA